MTKDNGTPAEVSPPNPTAEHRGTTLDRLLDRMTARERNVGSDSHERSRAAAICRAVERGDMAAGTAHHREAMAILGRPSPLTVDQRRAFGEQAGVHA